MSMRVRTPRRPDLYPNWQKKTDSPTKQAKIRDGQHCVDCGVADRTLIADELGQPRYILYLHGAHLHPLDPWFYQIEPIEGQRLRARCPRCHRIYDLHWAARAEEVEHQRRLHGILLDGWIACRFLEVI
jgi:hypothetical protein